MYFLTSYIKSHIEENRNNNIGSIHMIFIIESYIIRSQTGDSNDKIGIRSS